MNDKVALITGVNGMIGSHMADFLLEKGYKIFGLERRSSVKNRTNTNHLENKIEFLVGDLTDQNSLLRAVLSSNADEIYNFAAQSFVGESWNTPEQTSDVTALGVLRILEAIRERQRMDGKHVRFFQASSSEMFGRMVQNPANEDTPFYPRSPYGVSKLYGHWITKNYRESHGMFNCSGIMFNNESERRGYEFVTRKISDGVAKIYCGISDCITLGNLEAKRDWSYSPDFCFGIWKMMQMDKPDDYVLASGVSHSIRDFLDVAFSRIGILDWSKYVKQDPKYFRPAEVDVLRGDYSKAKENLGWQPQTDFKDLVFRMVDNDIRILENK